MLNLGMSHGLAHLPLPPGGFPKLGTIKGFIGSYMDCIGQFRV